MKEYLNVLRHHYADFRGRARRREYWMYYLVTTLITLILRVLDGVLGLSSGDLDLGILSGIYTLVVLLPGLAVSARRLHDTGRSGWWLLFGLIPIVGGIVLLIFTLSDSEPDANKWGPNPKGVQAGSAVAW